MTNPDALAGVVARVTWLADRLYGLPGEKQLLKLTPQGAERYAVDLRTLLSALAEARSDIVRLRERDELAQREFKRWGKEMRAVRALAMRTPQPETPE